MTCYRSEISKFKEKMFELEKKNMMLKKKLSLTSNLPVNDCAISNPYKHFIHIMFLDLKNNYLFIFHGK